VKAHCRGDRRVSGSRESGGKVWRAAGGEKDHLRGKEVAARWEVTNGMGVGEPQQ